MKIGRLVFWLEMGEVQGKLFFPEPLNREELYDALEQATKGLNLELYEKVAPLNGIPIPGYFPLGRVPDLLEDLKLVAEVSEVVSLDYKTMVNGGKKREWGSFSAYAHEILQNGERKVFSLKYRFHINPEYGKELERIFLDELSKTKVLYVKKD